MPRLLEKSVLFEETLVKPFPPVTMDSESIKGNQAQGKSFMPTVPLGQADTRPLTRALVVPGRDCSKSGVAVLAGERGCFCQFVFASIWMLGFRVTEGKGE